MLIKLLFKQFCRTTTMERIVYVYSKFYILFQLEHVLLCITLVFVKLHEENKSLLYSIYEILSEYCQDHDGFYFEASL